MEEAMYGNRNAAHEFYLDEGNGTRVSKYSKRKKKYYLGVLLIAAIGATAVGTTLLWDGGELLSKAPSFTSQEAAAGGPREDAIAMNSIAFAEGLYAPLSRFDDNEQAGPLAAADNVQTASSVISAPKAGESVQAQAQDKAKEAPKKSASELTNKSQAAAESRLSVVTAKENTAAPSEKAAKANVKPSEDKVQTSAATVRTNPQSSTYRVKNGDTLYSISLAFYNTGDYVQLLADTNHLQSSSMLKEGQQLEIPYLPPADAKKAGSKANVAANGSNSSSLASSSDAAQRAISDNGKMINHVVKSGESLSSISQKYFGSPNFTEFIALLNNRSADAPLKVGETLVILPSGQD